MKNLLQVSTSTHFTLFNVTIAILFLFSCKQKTDYTKEISRLDSSSAVLIVTEKKLLSVDTNSLRIACNIVSQDLHNLTEMLSKDTVNKKTAMLLSVAYEQAGDINNLLTNKANLARAINESKQTINNLTHDLKESLIEKNKSAAYIVNEISCSQKISNIVNETIEKATTSLNHLDSLKKELSFLTDSLKN